MPALAAVRFLVPGLPRLDPAPAPARPSPHRPGQAKVGSREPSCSTNLAADLTALAASRPDQAVTVRRGRSYACTYGSLPVR